LQSTHKQRWPIAKEEDIKTESRICVLFVFELSTNARLLKQNSNAQGNVFLAAVLLGYDAMASSNSYVHPFSN